MLTSQLLGVDRTVIEVVIPHPPRKVGRPRKLSLERQQLFTSYYASTIQPQLETFLESIGYSLVSKALVPDFQLLSKDSIESLGRQIHTASKPSNAPSVHTNLRTCVC